MEVPEIPDDLPEEQKGTAELRLRYEDVTQDGRLALTALPPALGAVVWQKILASTCRTRSATPASSRS